LVRHKVSDEAQVAWVNADAIGTKDRLQRTTGRDALAAVQTHDTREALCLVVVLHAHVLG
jgi:hypothetical protein